MDFKAAVKAILDGARRHSPEIFVGLGLVGFGTTVAMTAKAAPTVRDIHEAASEDRRNLADATDIRTAEDEEALKRHLRELTIEEAKCLAPMVVPIFAVGITSVACILASNRIQANRKAAVMAAYSLSEKTLATYQRKVIEKLGEEAHQELVDETSKEIARTDIPEGFDHEKCVVPPGMVRVYDNVTGRYFWSSKERILEAESSVNKRLLNETRVPLQEFYYELGMEETFHLGESMGWDISSPYMENTLNIWFTPMLDDDKNPCLALNYHVLIFDRSV